MPKTQKTEEAPKDTLFGKRNIDDAQDRLALWSLRMLNRLHTAGFKIGKEDDYEYFYLELPFGIFMSFWNMLDFDCSEDFFFEAKKAKKGNFRLQCNMTLGDNLIFNHLNHLVKLSQEAWFDLVQAIADSNLTTQ